MQRLIFFFLIVAAAPIALGAELVTKISWNEAAEKHILLGGEVSAAGELKITANSAGRLIPIIALDNPDITLPVYALKGMIRYSDVTGDGYLQLDNHFEGRGVFFTKSLAPNGPLQKISGYSDWRPFILPFFANTGEGASSTMMVPEKLSFAVYLPGSGTVSLKEVALYQYASGENPIQGIAYGAKNSRFGLLGGIGGSLLGLWGAAIGTLSGLGRARWFVMGSLNLFGVIGVASLVGGLAAIATAQPAQLYYPLILFGVLLLASLMLRKNIRARYETLELRKMTSIDTGL